MPSYLLYNNFFRECADDLNTARRIVLQQLNNDIAREFLTTTDICYHSLRGMMEFNLEMFELYIYYDEDEDETKPSSTLSVVYEIFSINTNFEIKNITKIKTTPLTEIKRPLKNFDQIDKIFFYSTVISQIENGIKDIKQSVRLAGKVIWYKWRDDARDENTNVKFELLDELNQMFLYANFNLKFLTLLSNHIENNLIKRGD